MSSDALKRNPDPCIAGPVSADTLQFATSSSHFLHHFAVRKMRFGSETYFCEFSGNSERLSITP
jgi:hypothetical protein